MSEEKLKTIQEWAKEDGYKIIDPDGFDRTDPELMTKKITKKEFNRGVPLCTVVGINDNKIL